VSTYKSLLTEVRTLKKLASADFKEKLLSLLNSGEEGQINQAILLNESYGLIDQEIGDLLIPTVIMSGRYNTQEHWKQDGLGWELLEKYPKHPLWKNLLKLDFQYFNLTSLPSSIGNLTNVYELLLRENNLTSLPKEIGNLRNLYNLSVSLNNLKSIPKEIGKLKNLLYLDLYSNNLSSLPKEIGNLKNLEQLYLTENNLTIEDVPPNLRKVTLF